MTPIVRLTGIAGAALALMVLSAMGEAEAGRRFEATVTGQGPDVILLPGLGCSADVWDETVARLSATHRVHALQVRGFAGLPAGPNADGPVLAPLVRDVADYAAALDAPQMIGHSLGGLVGLEVAARHPEALAGLLVVDALPFYGLVYDPQATVETIAPQARMIRDQMLNQTAEQFELSQTMSMRSLVKSDAQRPDVLAWTLDSDRRVMARVVHEDLTTDARQRLEDITIPVTVLYAWDPAMGLPAATVDGLYGTSYAGLADVRLRRVDGSFHFIMFDQPHAFFRAVDRVLE